MAESLVIKINGDISNYKKALKDAGKETKELENLLSDIAKPAAIAFAALATVIGVSTVAFAKYEKALIGVGKTTDINGVALENFGKSIQDLSKRIPVATNELLGIAQAAGQLGVRGEKDLLKFTETVAKLGVATDLSGEKAALALTRILTVTGEGVGEIDTFGSVIVALGNNFAATESEIVRMATEVSRSTAIFGVSSAQAAGLSTALKAVGVQAQLGGSAVGRAFRAIDAAVRSGGKELKNLTEITGTTGEEITKVFKEDSTKGFQVFIQGLGRIAKEGGDTTAALDKMGLKGEEILKVLPVLAQRSELVGAALKTAADEAENATALNEEAAKAFSTLDSKVEKLKNSITVLTVNMGKLFSKQIIPLIDGVGTLVEGFSNLDDETKENIASMVKWAAIIAGGIAAIATFGAIVLKLSAFIGILSAAFLPGAVAASAFWVAVTGPIGIAIAGIVALTAASVALFAALDQKEAPKTLEDVNDQLDELKAKRDFLNRTSVRLGGGPAEVAQVDEEIKKLEELRMAKIRAGSDFGTGELLVRPVADKGANLGPEAFGLEAQQAIPFKTDTQGIEEANEEKLRLEKERIEKEKQLRFDEERAKDEEFQTALASAREKSEIKTEEELLLFQEAMELKREEKEIAKIQELEDEGRHDEAIVALEELKNEKIIEASKKKIEADKKMLKEKEAIDKMNLQATQNFISAGAMLAKDGSAAQKILLSANALISTYTAVNQALAQPPGPPHTIPLASSIGVLGLANVAKINSVGFADGGMFMGGIPGIDSIPATVQQGEIIAPTKSFDEVVEGTARQRGFTREDEGGGSGGMITVVIEPKDEMINFIQQQIVEVELQNTGV